MIGPNRSWSRFAALLPAAAAVACAGGAFEPPSRTPSIVAEEKRVAALMEARESEAGGGRRASCSVRILGMEGASTFAWTTCTSVDASGVSSGVSAPTRIDGDSIRAPQDGAGYAESVRSMFPDRLAEAVLEDPDGLRPSLR